MLDLAAVKVISSALPFMVVSAAPQTVNRTRVVEALVIAAVSGALIAAAGMYVALPVLTEKLDGIRRDVARLEQTVRDNRSERERDLEKIKIDISQIKVDQARGR